MLVVAAAWAGAYLLRFNTSLAPRPPGPHIAADYLTVGAAALPLFYVLLRYRGLYEPRRGLSRFEESRSLVTVATAGAVVIAAGTFFWLPGELSRLVVLVFWLLSAAGLVVFRAALRASLGILRARRFNTRSVLIVGTGALAHEVWARFKDHPETGFEVIGFLGRPRAHSEERAPPNLGPYERLHAVVTERSVDQVILALDRGEPADPIKLVDELADSTTAVRIVPDLLGLHTVRAATENFDGLPMICLVESPLLGWDDLLKRGFDVVFASGALAVLSPVLAAIALAGRLSSPEGPVLYRQKRMSLDGRLFEMLKFRTMVPDAEAQTGPTWATPDDPRRTRFGRFLRRFNLDELPQLWNVLRGEMSLVGPRPERPELIEGFRREIPGYMRRHKVKGGLTGWAQVNGLRGNTSIEKRLEFDLEYAQLWSLLFDVKILALTLLRGFRDPNAY